MTENLAIPMKTPPLLLHPPPAPSPAHHNQGDTDEPRQRRRTAGTTGATTGSHRACLDATARLAPTTVTSYTAHTAGYPRWLAAQHPTTPLAETQPCHVEGYPAALAARGCAGATRRVALHALRSFYQWHRPDTGTLNPAAATRQPRSRPPLTSPYTEAEAHTLLAATGPDGSSAATPRLTKSAGPQIGTRRCSSSE